ncbi:MAG: hypothetical protein OEZ48_09525 [Candidatus Bathyarchaeota archaeon]|nr:hypothetical protein [Candidatus Bathyarchaeota archaeon]
MKRIKLYIHEPAINKIIGRELQILLNDDASLVDVIREVDKLISSKGSFPVSDYQSLLHMVYNPIENRFYNQVAVTAYREPRRSLNVREDPKKNLPKGITVALIPKGGCISKWEEAIDYEELLKAMHANPVG